MFSLICPSYSFIFETTELILIKCYTAKFDIGRLCQKFSGRLKFDTYWCNNTPATDEAEVQLCRFYKLISVQQLECDIKYRPY
jgi:hypothetical protein